MEFVCPPSANYCIDNEDLDDECVKNPGEICNNKPPFSCNEPGFFPSDDDCNSYYYCQPIRRDGVMINLIPHEAKCVHPKPIFNPDIYGQCERLTIFNRICQPIFCEPYSNGVIRKVRNYRRHYYICAGSIPHLFQCPENMDVDSQKLGHSAVPCSYSCQFFAQAYADDNDSNIYYQCFCVGSVDRCRPIKRICPRFYIYDNKMRRCILLRSFIPSFLSEESNENI